MRRRARGKQPQARTSRTAARHSSSSTAATPARNRRRSTDPVISDFKKSDEKALRRMFDDMKDIAEAYRERWQTSERQVAQLQQQLASKKGDTSQQGLIDALRTSKRLAINERNRLAGRCDLLDNKIRGLEHTVNEQRHSLLNSETHSNHLQEHIEALTKQLEQQALQLSQAQRVQARVSETDKRAEPSTIAIAAMATAKASTKKQPNCIRRFFQMLCCYSRQPKPLHKKSQAEFYRTPAFHPPKTL